MRSSKPIFAAAQIQLGQGYAVDLADPGQQPEHGARDHGEAVARNIPNHRIGVAEDMAAAAIYLASNAGNYVVGDTITVDGGVAHANIGSPSIDA